MSDRHILARLSALERTVERLRKVDRPGVAAAYTPTYTGGSSAGTTTYTTQVGAYVRVGALIHFTAFVVWSAATGTGNARLSLPFTAANTTDLYFTPTVWHFQVTYTGTGIMGLIAPNTDYVEFHTPTSNGATAVLAVEAAGRFVVSGFFYV